VAYFQQLIAEAQKRMGLKLEKKTAKPEPDVNSPVIPFKRPSGEPSPADSVRREIADLRRLVEVLVAETPGINMPAEYAVHYKALMDAGVARKAAAELLAAAIRDSDLAIIRSPRVFTERVANEIRKRVCVTGGIGLSAGTCRRVALVGATGVGKTTNLAKLAAQFGVRQHATVGLITADTYRVAAPEQLRVFANIIGLPMKVVNNAREMTGAIESFRGCDVVLIDTAGGSQFNKGQLRELREMLQGAAPHEILLMLAANTQFDDQQQIVTNFMPLKPTSLFFSKLDETRRYGSLYTVLAETGLPMSYLSTGQDVPNDLVLAQPDIVADLVLRGRSERLGAAHER
jgi:flagellar biosynthesis protein FlhF